MKLCLLFIQIAVFWLCRCVTSSNAYIISPPQNAVIFAGDEVTLTCATNRSENAVQWMFSYAGIVISDDSSVPCVSSNSYFKGNSSSAGMCNIHVLPDELHVSGHYGCTDKAGPTYYAHLVVIVSQPACVPDVDPVVRGATFNLICSGNFTLGSDYLKHQYITAWISCDGIGSSNRADYKITKQSTNPQIFQLPSIQFPMNASGSSLENYKCTAHFEFADSPVGVPVAKNSVNYTYTSDESVTFHYCPGDVIITNLSGRYFGGDELNCSADSYPPPSYQWIGLAISPIDGPTVKLPTNGGSFNVTCSATGDLLDRNCTAYSQTISVFAVVCPYNVTINPTNPVVTVNTTLTCAANSTSQSPATYLWTSLLDNGTVSGPRITIDKPGSYSWECSVSVPEGGPGCNSSQTISGTAVVCPGESNTVITSSGGSGSVLVGDVFNCSLHTDQTASYQWYDGSGHLLSSLSSVVVDVSGVFNWTCVATVTVGSFSCNGSTSVNGTAYECPSNVTIDPSSTRAVKLFDNLTCSASGSSASRYSWRDETRSELSTTTVLSVNTTGQHGYTCTVTLTAGNRNCADNKTISVTVVDCPHDVTIQSSAGSEPLLVGDVLNCSATSYPAANYSWYDDRGQLLSSGSTVNVTRAAAFRWTCNASVSVDGLVCGAFNSINATALECPSNITIDPSSTRAVKLFDNLTCSASGSSPSRYSWRDETGSELSTTTVLSANTTGQHSYTCSVTLTAGNRNCSDNKTISVTVVDCPHDVTIQSSAGSEPLLVGDVLNCSATSYPAANYSWYDDSGQLLSSASTVSVTSTAAFKWTCNASVSVDGLVCGAFNSVNATALECPSNIIIDPSSTRAVKLFDNLTCSASGSSPSHYSWRDETGSELSTTTVLSLNTPGQHSYTCSVTLAAGNRNCSDNKTISVTVVDCPHDVTIQSSSGSEPLLVGDVLNCSATSYPAANYSWHDDSGQLVSSVSTVSVISTAPFKWTCNASVSVEGLVCGAFKSTNATPLECPSNVTIEPWSRRVAKLHDSFQCFSSGNVTNFTWLNDARAMESTTHTLTVTNLGGNLTYTCRSTLHAGNRQCNASQQITIDVIDCPSSVTIQSPSSSSAIYVGDTFNCTAVSSAHISYSWYDQYNNLLSNDSAVAIRTTGDFVLNCTATVELNGFICVNSTIFNGTATIATTITTAASTPTTSVASTSTDSTTSSTTSSTPTTVAATPSTSSVLTTSPTSYAPTTSSTVVFTATTTSSLLSSTASATATTTITKETSSIDTASSTEGNAGPTADNTSPSATTTQNPAVPIIEIAVPVTVGLVAMATAGVWCSYYAFSMAKRGIKLPTMSPTGQAKPAVAEPSVYSPGYAFRPYYGNGNGRF